MSAASLSTSTRCEARARQLDRTLADVHIFPLLLPLQALRTNNRIRSHPAGTYIEAGYSKASTLLKGQPLNAGDEMGGFKLGSTIVMVFEAPRNFQFDIKEGELVKVGQPMGTYLTSMILLNRR